MILKSLKNNYQVKKNYSSLTGKKNGDKEYEHVLKVWDRFKMKMMKEYHNLYLLLADVFENFKNGSLKIFCKFQVIISVHQF